MARLLARLCLLACACWAFRALAEPQPTRTAQLAVDIVGLHSDKGKVFAAVYCSESGFPGDFKKACANHIVSAKGRRVQLLFDALPAGDVAVSMFHDENSNSTLDRNFLGIPKEGWGASRDAKANFGPPSFEDARLRLAAGEHKQIAIHVQY
jgi:uncharacterized protein (DUF2141 family)